MVWLGTKGVPAHKNPSIRDNKSILANTDWKKLWLESGQLSSSGRIDNHLDSSDSTLIDDGESSHNILTLEIVN
uniref:Uncharacterized protein n=1 Tax=Anopheles minimus TaxID=112268 RepID=A0A182WCF9_9DIPT